ncbi:MAG: thioredoxin domain-containing protein [Calditrichaceae bacterium]|nr:thioredoxin domain-containing protein [Calditrichia bacterium]NUQ40948.1 thioredoxin domain-containing protein [Calditrichaceae bacterium]
MFHKKPNRLINEKSPYLLQHAENPVDWYPWGAEAFAAAQAQDKPIFLSIGYSTCHWCHVMEHESFEDSAVAALMNETFINIKVDREERPDVDDVYMTACQMLTGSGGWPLTIIMTPAKEPFFAATYIPKERRFNRYGMLELIPQIKNLWESDRDRLLESAQKITEALSQTGGGPAGGQLHPEILEIAYSQLEESYEHRYGGFNARPKFPTPHNLMYLLRFYRRSGDRQALEMVETTLQNMRRGGIFDHLGFGFHRYSTDERWMVPHFEKMLYDQALLALACTEAFQVTGKEEYRDTVREILTYVLRDMADPAGGFYSAEDADSEGEEGKFYLWSNAEIRKTLGKSEGDFFIKVFNCREDGNFLDEAARQKTGTNIPHLRKSSPKIAKELAISEAELARRIEQARQKLFAARERRIHPLKDDKILTDWNGLMVAALGKAAQALGEPAYAAAAARAADFILQTLRTPEGRLLHRYRQGETAIPAYLDDYAFFIWGLLELYETGFEVKYLQAAVELNDIVLRHFWDGREGGFFFTADDAEELLVRKKEIYDGAVPSGNSVMALNLLRLARITGETGLEARAAQIGAAFSANVSRYPAGYTFLMLALDFAVGPNYEVVIVGKPGAEDTRAMAQALQQRFIPNKVLLFLPVGKKDSGISRIAGFIRAMKPLKGRAAAYVCRSHACELPTADVEKMLELLGQDR